MLRAIFCALVLSTLPSVHSLSFTPLYKNESISAFGGKLLIDYGPVDGHADLIAIRVTSEHVSGYTGIGWNSFSQSSFRMVGSTAFVVSDCVGCSTEGGALRNLVTQDDSGPDPNPILADWQDEVIEHNVTTDNGFVYIELIKNTSVGTHQEKAGDPRTLVYTQASGKDIAFHAGSYASAKVTFGSAPVPPETFKRSLLGGKIELEWTPFVDTGIIDYKLVSQDASAYAAIGWNPNGPSMVGSTAYLFSGCASCDTKNPGQLFSLGAKDAAQVTAVASQAEIDVKSYEVTDGKLSVHFTKDTAQGAQFDLSQDVGMVFAVGPAGGAKAQHVERGVVNMNFVNPPPPPAGDSPSKLEVFSGDLVIEWVADAAKNTIDFKLTSATPATYFGFGWNSDGAKMIGSTAFLFSDCASCATKGGALFSLGAKSPSQVKPVTGTDEITIKSFESKDGKLVVEFTKDANKGEKFNVGKDVGVVYARGGTAGVSQHGSAEARLINFASGSVGGTETDVLRWVHGVMMILSWGVLLPLGMFFARFYKHRNPWWFQMHRTLQVSGLLLATVGFILALVMVDGVHFKEPNTLHKVLGLVIMIFGWLQPLNAFVRPHPGEPKRQQWNYIHWGLGRSAIALGLLNIIFGLIAIDAPVGLTVVYYIWLVAYALAFCVKNAQLGKDGAPTATATKTPAHVETD